MTSSTNTPDSAVQAETDTPQGNGHVAKDRPCQYCGQAFTSSSLGRHLDQFISKKKPDGVHNVEEIKEMRASITRRQARGSNIKQDEDRDVNSKTSGQTDRQNQQPLSIPFVDKTPPSGLRIYLNQPNWQSTGVINGLQSSSSGSSLPLAPISVERPTSVTELPTKSDGQERDTIRALELALREVLDTVQAASARTAVPQSPFDFDFAAQSYPSLCLLLLPPPPMLRSTNPFSLPNTLPLEPPGPQHLDPLRLRIQDRLDQWRSAHIAETPLSQSRPESSKPSLQNIQQHSEMARQHLDLAYHNWTQQSIEAKQEQWRLEIMRAYVQESDRCRDMGKLLSKAEQELRRLQAHNELLSRCQLPREFALFPPEARPFSRELAQGLQNMPLHKAKQDSSSMEDYWDFDALVRKWKKVVSEDSARTLSTAYNTSSLRLPLASPRSATSSTTITGSDGGRSTSAPIKPTPSQMSYIPPAKKPKLAPGSD